MFASGRLGGPPRRKESGGSAKLHTKEKLDGAGDLGNAATLFELGSCAREAGEPEEAERLSSRLLEFFGENRLDGHDQLIAVTL